MKTRPATTTAIIRLGSLTDYEWALKCPNCGNDYLHHDRITVFDRPEDAPHTVETKIDGAVSVTVVRSEQSRNPSSRRDGLAIRFWCEGCPATPELTIEQDKGNTYLAWRDITPTVETAVAKKDRASEGADVA